MKTHSLFTAALLSFSLLVASSPRAEARPLHSGSVFPVEQLEALPQIAGTENLQLKGNMFVVIFWASWCGYCKRQLPDISALQPKLAPHGVKILGVSKEESKLQATSYAKTLGFPQYYDEGQKLSSAAGINGIPHVYIVDKDGKVVAGLRGYSPNAGRDIESLVTSRLK